MTTTRRFIITFCLAFSTIILIISNAAAAAYPIFSVHGKNSLTGVHLKWSLVEYPILYEKHISPHGDVTYSGICLELLEAMTFYFNMTWVYVPVDPEEYRKFGFNALLNMLKRKEVDFVPYVFELTWDLAQSADPSFLVESGALVLLQPWPEKENRLLSVLTLPFSTTVWMLFIVSTVAFIGAMAALMHDSKEATWSRTIGRRCVYAVNIITFQGDNLLSNRLSLRLLVGPWLLMMVVITYAYTGVLTSLLAAPRVEPIANTFDEIVNVRNWRVTCERGRQSTERFLNAQSGVMKQIGDSLRKHPDRLLTDYSKAVASVLQGKTVYYGSYEISLMYAAADYKLSGKCRLAVEPMQVSGTTAVVPVVLAWQKGSIYTDIVNKGFGRFYVDNGYMQYFMRPIHRRVPQCRPDAKPNVTFYKLVNFSAIFLLFGIGIGMSVVAFLLELIVWNVKQQHRRRRCMLQRAAATTRVVASDDDTVQQFTSN